MSVPHPTNIHIDAAILERDFIRRLAPDGTVEYIHRSLEARTRRPSKAQNQMMRAMRRKAAGKPSYRQRQQSARAARAARRTRVA